MNAINEVKETVTSFFSGNPFNSVVGQKIDEATNADLASEDWSLNMQICDLINSSEEAAKDAVRAIKKKLQQNIGKNCKVTLFILTILETCVKNCSRRFHLLICNKDFVNDLVKLIGPKNDPPILVQERVLNLIQVWAQVFTDDPELQGVVQVYHELRIKGIEFPSCSLDNLAPIQTPPRSVKATIPVTKKDEPTPPVMQEHLAKLHSQLDIVRNNMSIFNEMLLAIKPEQENSEDLELLDDLYSTCQDMQQRILRLLEKITNPELTEELLQINDDLNNLFLRYQRCQRSQQSKEVQEEAPLIILNTDNSEAEKTNTAKDNNQVQEDAEFESFTRSRNETSSESSSNLPQPKACSSENDVIANEQDHDKDIEFEEVEAWLKNKPIDHGVTSVEFDRFLEERATNLESPSITESQSQNIKTATNLNPGKNFQ